MKPIRIGNRTIGDGQPTFVVAEIGINHNGDVELAKKSIQAASIAGADSVKFQSYETDDFIREGSLTYTYESGGKTITESQVAMFKRCELTPPDFKMLKAYSDERNVNFHATPTSVAGVRRLVELGVEVLKNGSDFLTRLDVVKAMGRSGLPTVLSTGMATLAEIESAVTVFRKTGNNQLILLHCTSSYPTAFEDVHLNRMTTLRKAFNCPVGFSDHSIGSTASIGAVALGACWIEKHFTTDKNLPGPDHRFSVSPMELEHMVQRIREIETCMGSPALAPSKIEAEARTQFRVSCAAACRLREGHVLSDSDIVFLRPASGLAPAHKDRLIGRQTVRDLRAGETIGMNDVN
ncbi:MAG: N-acetylneuraminate synthase family protein [Phycisphaerae bacterium]